MVEHRPWGTFLVLAEEALYKVKEINVLPGKRLSLQRHQHRSERWLVISGQGWYTLGTSRIRLIRGSQVHILRNEWHRLEADKSTRLTILEIQTGSYFGEDDIERKEDDYGRTE